MGNEFLVQKYSTLPCYVKFVGDDDVVRPIVVFASTWLSRSRLTAIGASSESSIVALLCRKGVARCMPTACT